MKKKEIIKESRDFSKIINKKVSIYNKYYSIYYQKSDILKFGITVPTKTGKAVIRNKLKRQVKSIIDNNKNSIKNNYNYVIIIRKNLKDLNYQEKEKNLLELFNRIGEYHEKKK